MILAVVGFVGAAVTMMLHLMGVALGWWNHNGITWVVSLLFFLLMAVGNLIDSMHTHTN